MPRVRYVRARAHTHARTALQGEPSAVCMAAGQLEDASIQNVRPRHDGGTSCPLYEARAPTRVQAIHRVRLFTE